MAKFKDAVITTGAKWTVRQFCEYADQGTVTFDNVIQRNLVWNTSQKSLYIHSLIVNFLPPEFLANKKDGIFDMVDGKQRNNAMSTFIKNDYRLINVPDVNDVDGNAYELNGKYFKDLDQELQDKILSRALEVSIMDNAPQEVVKEYFYRRNNGTPLTAARKTFSKAKSFDEIGFLSRHPIFEIMFSTKAKGGDNSKGVVMRSYAILFCENKSMENKKIFQYIQSTEFEESGIKLITKCYDILVKIYEDLKENEKANKKVMKRMMTKTHTLTLLPIVKYVIENDVNIEALKDWICHFFASVDGATVSKIYNENATTGSSKMAAVVARLEAMENDFMEFISK